MRADGALLRRTQTAACIGLWVGLHACASPAPLPNLDDASRDLRDAQPVFPGAEGFGTDTPAGRGGAILVVDTLDPEGPGSLAEAIRTEGPRTIVFAVGGEIALERALVVDQPFVTLAGQTAPSPGITLTGGGLSIQTHDVLVQHLAVRPGDGPGHSPHDRDAVQVIGNEDGTQPVYNVVIDHVSMSWAIDEGFSTWHPGVRDVTVRRCLIAETLDDSLHPNGRHSKAFLIGDHTRRVSMLENVLAHSDDRNPTIKGDTSSLVAHNLIYNPGRWPVGLFDPQGAGPMVSSVVGNRFVYGPSSQPDHALVLVDDNVREGALVFVDGNVGPTPEFDGRAPHDVRVDAPPVSVLPMTASDPAELESWLLDDVGSRPFDRDPNDARVLESVRARTGRIIDRVEEVGFVRPASTRHELTLPERPSMDDDGDGYTNLEAWLWERAEG